MDRRTGDLQTEIIDIVIRVGAIGLLVAACLWILTPFAMAVAWGAIIAVAVHPVFRRIADAWGHRPVLAASVVTLILLALFIVPAILLAGSLWGGARALANEAHAGSLSVPPPPMSVASWPLVGAELHALWAEASTNLEAVVRQFTPEIRAGATWLVTTAAGTGFTLVQFVLSVVIAGVLLARGESASRAAQQFMVRLAGEHGLEYATLAAQTVQSVTRGILGVAAIQALLVGIGFVLVGLPFPGLLTFLCLILGILQLPMALITIPAILYVVSTASTVESALFVGWNVLVTPADNVLKPLLLGRGSSVPTLVLFLGSLGGFIGAGLIGLFVGAVVLSLGFVLYRSWLEQTRGIPAGS